MNKKVQADYYFAGNRCFEYLLSSIRENGTFIYELHSKSGVLSEKYNILRHAGSIYSMYQWLNLCEDSTFHSSLEKPVYYLLNQVYPVSNTPEKLLCTVEQDEAKLGGSALTLLMLIERYKAEKNTIEIDIIKGLAKFIVWMQEPSGKFKSKLLFKSGIFPNFVSTYYPGQAILALVRLYKIDPDPVWLNTAERGVIYLLKNPVLDSRKERGHNHWLAIALSELCTYKANEDYYQELYFIIQPTIASVYKNLNNLTNEENFHKLYSSAAMATRGEAIIAVALLEAYVENDNKAQELLGTVQQILSYCLSLQITASSPSHSFNIIGGIKKGKKNSNIRIDYVQHVLHVIIGCLSTQSSMKTEYI